MYSKESLQRLRERIDLREVISTHIQLKRSGSSYKAICPFHEEKTPSFILQKGDTHYHCFGCGAHGDAIQFLMTFLNLSFMEAIESLSERFNVKLEETEANSEERVNKTALKEALERALKFFQCSLLYTEEGEAARQYLYRRGLTIDFIKRFEVGLAPATSSFFHKAMREAKISNSILLESGLLREGGRPFFSDRITFPIRNALGSVIGFSARKYKESTFGGKYINSPETVLFKKSRLLFGLNFSRRRIAKERRCLIVEGQIDCLKLIEAGLNLTVAALGTAFTEDHIRQLDALSIRQVYLLFDADEAGRSAASKVGHLFQKVGIEVKVVHLPQGSDPDAFLTKYGAEKLIEKLEKAQDYLPFQVEHLARELNPRSPAGKTELVKTLSRQIREWEEPVMVHESLKKVAALVQIPEEMVDIKENYAFDLYAKKSPLLAPKMDPNRVLELDLLRWLILMGDNRPDFIATACHYLTEEHFWVPVCRQLFQAYLSAKQNNAPSDLLSLVIDLDDQSVMDEILLKKVNKERAEKHFIETAQRLLDRQWMHTREEIKKEIMSGHHSEEKVLELAKQFDALKIERKKVVCQRT
ncbi:MAG: DNA primase [Chlamydiales bacterium]